MQYGGIFHVFSEDDILPFSEIKIFLMLFGWQILWFNRASIKQKTRLCPDYGKRRGHCFTVVKHFHLSESKLVPHI